MKTYEECLQKAKELGRRQWSSQNAAEMLQYVAAKEALMWVMDFDGRDPVELLARERETA